MSATAGVIATTASGMEARAMDLELINFDEASVGLVLSGQAVAKMDDGTERLMKAGDFFYVPPGHDSWVVGDEPYVSLHIVGSENYATPSTD
jgi:hypothetical protein